MEGSPATLPDPSVSLGLAPIGSRRWRSDEDYLAREKGELGLLPAGMAPVTFTEREKSERATLLALAFVSGCEPGSP